MSNRLLLASLNSGLGNLTGTRLVGLDDGLDDTDLKSVLVYEKVYGGSG
jgi:hypothetical protein